MSENGMIPDKARPLLEENYKGYVYVYSTETDPGQREGDRTYDWVLSAFTKQASSMIQHATSSLTKIKTLLTVQFFVTEWPLLNRAKIVQLNQLTDTKLLIQWQCGGLPISVINIESYSLMAMWGFASTVMPK